MEVIFFLFLLLVLWPFLKGCALYLFDREEWRRVRAREHEARMENKRAAGGLLHLIGKFFK